MLLALPAAAQAHVRWFTDAAPAGIAPESMATLLTSPAFLALLLVTLAVLAWVRRVDARLAGGGSTFTRLLAGCDARMTPAAAPVLRVGLALFFAALALHFRDAPFTLTPELNSPADWAVPLKLLIALGLLFPSGMVAACAGMLLLYLHSTQLQGAVDILDYHLLFACCVFLSLDQFSRRHAAAIGLLMFRVLVASNFLWVGIERWLYPEWTSDVLERQLPMLLMGLAPHSWTMAAGFIEVAFAFLMVFGGASAQVAAAVMLALMGVAMPLVGPVDTVAHLPVLFSLFVLATTRNRLPGWKTEHARWQPADLCRVFLLGAMGISVVFYLAHEFTAAWPAQLAGIWLELVLAGVAGSALAWCGLTGRARRVPDDRRAGDPGANGTGAPARGWEGR